jgi:predicted Zn-dependent peptidase
VIAGNIDEEKAIARVSETFALAYHDKKDGKESVTENQRAPAAKLFFKETDQAHFVLGVRTFDVYDKRNPVLRVLSGILGGGMSSRLFQKIRDELAAAYYVGAANETFTDHGFFEVAAGVDQKRTAEVISVVLTELARLTRESVDREELKKVKDYLIGTMFLSLETSDALANLYGYQEIMRKEPKTPDEMRAMIEAVDAAAVQKLARELFVSEHLNLALVGRYKDESEFLPLLSF